jgi:hypothetical protein
MEINNNLKSVTILVILCAFYLTKQIDAVSINILLISKNRWFIMQLKII